MFELLEDVREKPPYTVFEAVCGFLGILLIGFMLGLMVGRRSQTPWQWLQLAPFLLLQLPAVIRLVKHTRIVRNDSRHAN
jgi:hypothetical protein